MHIFAEGGCAYSIETETGDVTAATDDEADQIDDNQRVVYARAKGRFGNRVTGIREPGTVIYIYRNPSLNTVVHQSVINTVATV